MKLKKLLLPLMLLFVSLASYAQEDTSLANVYFAPSKFLLTPVAKDSLKAFVDAHLKEGHMFIVGRCDKRGSDAYNDWLSVQRANTVTDFLVANGFPKKNIYAVAGYGKRKQLAVGATEEENLSKNRVATVTCSFATVQKLIDFKGELPAQFAVFLKKPRYIDTTYLNDTILVKPPYAGELLIKSKFPHKGDILKVEFGFFIRNDSPFVTKKLYVASATMEEPKPAPVVVAPPVAAAPAPKPPAPVAATPPAASNEIAENTEEDQLGRKVTEHMLSSKIGESLVIRGINFDFGYHRILKKDKPQLDAVQYAMKQIPTLKLEIQGHICCWPIGEEGFDRDTKEYNLSYNRAKAVYDYLIANGITADRLTYNGYGMKHPLIYPEKTKDDEYKNRRVEFKIVSK